MVFSLELMELFYGILWYLFYGIFFRLNWRTNKTDQNWNATDATDATDATCISRIGFNLW